MLFPDDNLSHRYKADLAQALSSQLPITTVPLLCDRWIARSALQKGIRRGDEELATQALARLIVDDPKNVWRHLIVIALEDVGPAGPEILAQLIAARRDSKWREWAGGDRRVLLGLSRLLAASTHCQANCDLLLKVENDPSLSHARELLLEADWAELSKIITSCASPLTHRAGAALAMGGGLADGQRIVDPNGLFETFVDAGCCAALTDICFLAWKLSRNSMALLMPLTWLSMRRSEVRLADDVFVPARRMHEVPGYALDQFTRTGNTINRHYLSLDRTLAELFRDAGIPSVSQVRALGDVLFLVEGGLTIQRQTWQEAENLRQPDRWLPTVAKLGHYLPKILAHCTAKASQIASVRRRVYPSVID